ncbi:MAG TPA: DoxX family protein [Stellaceae bacterium]|jgi:putative oxidoreductase
MATSWGPRFLSILRLVIGLLFLQHGLTKVFGWPHVAAFDHMEHLPALLIVPAFVETVCAAFFTIGLFTRLAAFIMSGEMAVAYFLRHAPNGFFPETNGGDLAVLFCFVFFYFFLVGGGLWSIDRWFRRVEV